VVFQQEFDTSTILKYSTEIYIRKDATIKMSVLKKSVCKNYMPMLRKQKIAN